MSLVAKANKRNSTGEARVAKVPRASDLQDTAATTTMALVEPSDDVTRKLGKHDLAIGVDIETADWVDQKYPLHKGQFGFFTMRGPDVFDQRIVQIGWFVQGVSCGSPIEAHSELVVQPQGFEVASKAAKLHGVTTERAWKEGLPLNVVLERFMRSVHSAHERGGRVVIHHLEFDAGIIDRELINSGLERWRPIWRKIAQQGFCTMDPDVGKWIQMSRGRVFDIHEESVGVMGLDKTIHLLAPVLPVTTEVENFRANKIHTAGADARLHCLIYIVLRELCEKATAKASESL